MGRFEGDVACVSLSVGGADDFAVFKYYWAEAGNVDVSSGLVSFGVAFDGDVVEVEVAGTEYGDVA